MLFRKIDARDWSKEVRIRRKTIDALGFAYC